MVSLWPWKGDDASPAAFERALSTLSTKIASNTSHLDRLRQRCRRFKALWTLYSTFAYILYMLVFALVVGWKNGGPAEYTGAAGGPVGVYLVRLGLTSYYEYRISTVTSRLAELQKERDATIEKLKAATKYNSTQELLEKYGGSSGQSTPGSAGSRRKSKAPGQDSPAARKADQQPGRVSIVPPPTANIPRNSPPSLPSTPQHQTSRPRSPLKQQIYPARHESSPSSPMRPGGPPQAGPPEFAPNAFPASAQYSAAGQSHWYDRVLDLLLGEDETLPKNRMALICQHCRLVNGQAPPGVQSLEEVGQWRCASCGGWNGEKSEAKKIIGEVQEQLREESSLKIEEDKGEEVHSSEEDAVLVRTGRDSESGGHDEGQEEEEPRPKPKRGRPKGSGKKKE